MTSNIQKLDHLHHKSLLGNQEAKKEFNGLLKKGLKAKDATAIRIADSLKKRRTGKRVSFLMRKYNLGGVERVVLPLYRVFNVYIIAFFLFMLAISEGVINVI